jgi:hypothetical protein
MIEVVEIGAAFLGSYLLLREVFFQRFTNYITTIFLLCYVPLFCVYPVIARLVVGGAISVHATNNVVLDDNYAYLVYQLANYGILGMCLLLQKSRPLRTALNHPEPLAESVYDAPALVLMLCVGVFLYVYSTGLSVAELLVASRFEWFQNENYSSLFSVVASYFIALTPVVTYLVAKEKRWYLLLLIIAILVFYGVLSKDRKWLIFIASGLLASVYMRSGRRLAFTTKGVTALALLGLILAFWQVARGVVFNAILTGSDDLANDAKEMAIILLTKGDFPYYYNASMTAIHMNINEGYSIPLGLLSRQLFFFLPVDFSLGLKIKDISAIFSDAIGGEDGNRGGNMPPGLFGLFVLSFHWVGGIVLLTLFPIFLKMLDSVARKGRGVVQIAIVSHAFSATLLLLRGDDSSATYFIVFSIIVLFLLRLSHAAGAREAQRRVHCRIARKPRSTDPGKRCQ